MEEDNPDSSSTLPRWVFLEYAQMLNLAGPSSMVIFAHLSKSSCSALNDALHESGVGKRQAKFEVHEKGIMELMREREIDLKSVCLLDPKAHRGLAPQDGEAGFRWFLFGGILGDDPPRDRTGELRQLGFPSRGLGPMQMTTDTALGVTKLVVEDKKTLESIGYSDMPTIRFNAIESIEMPFRYVSDSDGQPLLPPGMKDHMYGDLNQSFDF